MARAIPFKEANTLCAQCGWLKKDHYQGFCYSHSDEDSHHFYNDRKFVSIESLKGKSYSRAFNGKIIIHKREN